MDSKRRKLLGLLGVSPAILAGAKSAAASALRSEVKKSGGAAASADSSSASGSPVIEGLNPRGIPPPVDLYAMAPRNKTVEGKTIYLVWDGFPGGDTFLHEMQIWFSKHMPSVKTVYRRKAGGFTQDDPKLRAELKTNANGVIMAIGH